MDEKKMDEWGKKLIKLGLQGLLIVLIWQGYLYTIEFIGYDKAFVSLIFFGFLIISGNLGNIAIELKEMNKIKKEESIKI